MHDYRKTKFKSREKIEIPLESSSLMPKSSGQLALEFAEER
jgi:hypothetical protein